MGEESFIEQQGSNKPENGGQHRAIRVKEKAVFPNPPTQLPTQVNKNQEWEYQEAIGKRPQWDTHPPFAPEAGSY